MSKPKLLRVFDDTTTEVAYSKLNNHVEVTQSGDTLLVSSPIRIDGNTMLTFRAPCNCEAVYSITVSGKSYQLVDYTGAVIDNAQAFYSGSTVSVILDTSSDKAYLLGSVTSASVRAMIDGALEGVQADSYYITILSTDWLPDSTYSDYGYKYAYPLSGITSESIANLYLDVNSIKAANESGMLSATETVEGYVNFYSKNIPDVDLIGNLIISIRRPFSSVIETFNPDDYILKSQIGVSSGVASLSAEGKVPAEQLPTMDYVTHEQLNAAIELAITAAISGGY